MNYSILSEVIKELGLLLPGSSVERILEGDGNSIILELRQGRSRRHLLLSPDRSMPRIHLVSGKPASKPLAHPFTLFLKSRIAGARLTDARLLNEDRLVELCFRRRDALFHLFFELFGRAANLALTDGAGLVLAVFYPVPLSVQGTRPLLPGLRYEAPAGKGQRVQAALLQEPGLVPGGNAANRAAEQGFEQARSEKVISAGCVRLRSVTRKERERLVRKRAALLQDLANAGRADEFKRAGDLILAHLHQLTPGMTTAELTGHDGTTQTVLLEQKRTPVQNAGQYFKRYKKAKAGHAIITARLTETEQALALLKELESRLENVRSEQDLAFVENALRDKGFMKTSTPQMRKGRRESNPEPLRRIQLKGWEIVIGKNAAGNDYLSTKLARPDDLWFHAEGIPGSHVLVRNPRRTEVPGQIIARAASLAAFYSKARAAGKVPVTFTLSRYIKKPKGAKAGLVTVSQRTTIMAVPRES